VSPLRPRCVRSCFCFLCGFTSLFLGPFAFIIFALRRLLRQGVCDRTFFLCDVTSLVFVHFSSFFLLLCPCSCQGVSDFASLFSSCFLFLFLFASSPLSLLRQRGVRPYIFFLLRFYFSFCFFLLFRLCRFLGQLACAGARVHMHAHLHTNSCTIHSASTHLHTGHRQTQEPLVHHQKRFFFSLFFGTQGIAKLKNLSRTIKNFSLATGMSHGTNHGTNSRKYSL